MTYLKVLGLIVSSIYRLLISARIWQKLATVDAKGCKSEWAVSCLRESAMLPLNYSLWTLRHGGWKRNQFQSLLSGLRLVTAGYSAIVSLFVVSIICKGIWYASKLWLKQFVIDRIVKSLRPQWALWSRHHTEELYWITPQCAQLRQEENVPAQWKPYGIL